MLSYRPAAPPRAALVSSAAVLATLSAIVLAACTTTPVAPADVKPTNDLPNPYVAVKPWGQLPNGRAWGALSAVTIDNDGRSVWVADRCGVNPDTPPGESAVYYDSCASSTEAPIHKFDASGRQLTSFGAGMFVFPHKIYMDRAGNVWVLDNRSPNDREKKANPASVSRGHAVYKFSPDGKLLMTIGTPGRAGDPPAALTEPNSIVELPNGDFLISEGHSGQQPTATPATVARISRFTKDGRFVSSFGHWGMGPGEFRTPHDITLDGQGRLVVADRGNNRIQVMTIDGQFIKEMTQFSRPSGVALRGDTIYVADSESNGVAPHPGWERGIRIGSYGTGEVKYRIPDPDNLKGTSAAEGIAVDAAGNIFGAEVGPERLSRYALDPAKR
jgi:sugar lactone lactonase YvrE